jgi:hypothetical protein
MHGALPARQRCRGCGRGDLARRDDDAEGGDPLSHVAHDQQAGGRPAPSVSTVAVSEGVGKPRHEAGG